MANTFGVSAGFMTATMTGWHLVSSAKNAAQSVNVTKTATGLYLDNPTAYGLTFNYTDVYEADGDATGAPTITLGGTAAAINITGVSISGSNTTRPRITLTGHEHSGGTGTTHVTQSTTVTPPIPTSCYGGCDPFNGATGVAATEIQSFSWSATIDHVDAADSGGNFLCGKSAGTHYEASLEAVSDATPVVPAGWTMTTWSIESINDGFKRISLGGSKWIAT